MEESVKKNDFESREYQIELLELALKKNLILYLPTGSGKTFIATLLIKELGKRPNTLEKTIANGGKRTFFLVNTVALVDQQKNHLLDQTNFSVGGYSGDMGVDLWDKSVWLEEVDKTQILVMTVQIFVDLIEKNVISLKDVNLIIFDECHRAVSNHPMRQVMQNFKSVPVHQHPKILGLTATLLNGNIKPIKVKDEIKNLETTFMAQIATSTNEDLVKMYSTNPIEKKLTYRENDISGKCYTLTQNILGLLKAFVATVEIEDSPKPEAAPPNTYQIDNNCKKTNKRLKNLADDIEANMADLGIFGGSLAVLAHLVQVQQLAMNTPLETMKIVFQTITAECVYLRKRLEDEMTKQKMSELAILRHYSSDKVNKLCDILRKLKPNDSAIVFVKRRFTAKIVYYLLKKASVVDPQLKHIKSNFMVGYNIGNPMKDTRENYLQRNQNKKVMNQFNQGELNVMIASNVVEEGIDITQCNYVIMFDLPQDFRAYIQSKGRARNKESQYILMISSSDKNFYGKYQSYCEVEDILKQILYGGKSRFRTLPTQEELDENLFAETPGLEPYRPMGNDGPVITALSAISLINRYFISLKTDKFTKATPHWWIEEKDSRFKCFVQCPYESRVRQTVEGTWQQNKEDAKRSAALEACKQLHQSGELENETLLPLQLSSINIQCFEFTPNRDVDEVFEMVIDGKKKVKIGTKRHKRTVEKKCPDSLYNCLPASNEEIYLHVLDLSPEHPPPSDSNRLQVFFDTLRQPVSFAILSSKPLPKLAPFPLYMSTGKLAAVVREARPISLNAKQLKQLSNFHAVIFDKVLGVAKKFMIRDFTNADKAYFIVPVILDGVERVTIDWDVIEESLQPFPSPQSPPSAEERRGMIITNETYLGRIVSPWYRTVPAQRYIVTKVCFDMSENSKFPSEIYNTYKEYFKDKYKIEPVITDQPLLEVRPISNRLNCIKERALTKQLKHKNKDENEDFEVWLVPEFCVTYPLPGKYWLKALLLPSCLHRISQLAQAEELRSRIASETGVGCIELPNGQNWNNLVEDISLIKKKPVTEKDQALTPLPMLSKSFNVLKSPGKIWDDEEEPVDIERCMDSVTLFDVLNYEHFIGKPLLGVSPDSLEMGNGTSVAKLLARPKKEVLIMVEPPPLKMLQKNTSGVGPQQAEVMQALTAAVANDFVNCERLETLGDSFLKYAISLTLFETKPDYLEGVLTLIKGMVVGNKNLYFCGKKKNLGKILQVQDFSPNEEWVAPGFCVEQSVLRVLVTANLNPNCLYNVEIPEDERRSGKLSRETNDILSELMFEAESAGLQNYPFINIQALTDKNISDAVEAILGVYLKSCGIFGALAVLNWFGVTNPTSEEIFGRSTPHSPMKGKGDPDIHLMQPELLEKALNYKFRNRCFLLQALTHPSFTPNSITSSYQRLEFLGDALIDFLITIHIYEKCSTLSPGDLTDLRSALVNNVTLACISVRNEFHKFLLHRSSLLNECMMRFVKHQENRNHLIDNDILFLIEEEEINISESVDVPKALGDIFEALIGAIYLDSGKNLDLTWKIVYNLMKNEIETFHKDVPKNHVRMLHESNCAPDFVSQVNAEGTVMITVEIIHKDKFLKFNGFGDNKKQAKRAAAKHALRYIRSPSNISC